MNFLMKIQWLLKLDPHGGVGVVFVTPQEEFIPYYFTLMNRCSNNAAEYQALILGIEMDVNMKQL